MQGIFSEILFGKTIESKLISVPENEIDVIPHFKFSSDIQPGRPEHLEPVIKRKGKFDFPKASSFTDPKQRGKALHYFANHELEALELMALALLKFTDAPKNYRIALAGILSEEQKHLRLYLNRMRELGVEFGDYPVSGFFWQSLSRMEDIKKFTAVMNLTLEQANLDHCLFYRELFTQVGDHESSQIMDQVLRDEMGHVQHGLKWFQRWKENNSLWQAYLNELPPEMNPARARGRTFYREIRSEIGFDEDFIDNLEVFSQSRGRVPDLYYFYPFVEYELALGPHGINIPKKIYDLKSDLETLSMFLAKTDDIILVKEKPQREFLQKIKSAGFDVPEFVSLSEELKSAARRVHEFKPWGWCYHTKKLSEEINNFVEVAYKNPNGISYYNELYSKALSVKILNDNPGLCERNVIGKVCNNKESVTVTIQELQTQGYKTIVVKAVLGSSGQNQIKYSENWESREISWLKRLLKEQGKVIVEPWLDRIFDFSIQMRILPGGKAKFLGYSRFICDEAGKYRGTWLGGFEVGLTQDQIVFLHKNNHLKDITKKVITAVEAELKLKNYVGIAGIDCFVYRTQEGELKIKPVVEVNVRNNMGEVTIKFNSHLVSRKKGIWLILDLQDLKKLGYMSFLDLAQDWESHFPIQKDRNGLIEKGVLFTNDPNTAKSYCGLMAVDCDEALNKLSSAVLKLG